MGLWNKVKKAAKDTKKAFVDVNTAAVKVQTSPVQMAGRMVKGENPKDAFQNTAKDTLDSVDKASNSTRQWAGVQKKPNGQD
ncbi:hypothetical protein N9O38_01005 [Flavobacteriaceae bacterium]|nr:hypothetical protein [Flavobacteriaceae bacterium]|tara:strand:- start:1030 stop:1275 length:246 start_codon:yes stop_codon:yes gene_type:complete